MRVFWIAITVLVLAAAGAWVLRGRERPDAAMPAADLAAAPQSRAAATPGPALPLARESTKQPVDAAPARSDAQGDANPTSATPAPVAAPSPVPRADATGAIGPRVVPATPAATPNAPAAAASSPAPSPPANATGSADPKATPTPTPAAAPSPAPEPAKVVEPMPKTTLVTPASANPETPRPGVDAPKSEATTTEAPKPAAAESAKTSSGGETKPGAKVDDKKTDEKKALAKQDPPNPKMEMQDDGSFLVDDKYVLKGKGTKEDPFRITWEQLVSAQDSYQPRLGKKQIPDRVRMLDGKWIRISGYIAFPLMAQSQDEMLMMLNQWDGCCIGVPPTPYDAIEVKLKAAAKGEQRMRTTGTLTGVLRVDPYLVKDWLVSLYVMDDGELSDAAGQANPGQHAK